MKIKKQLVLSLLGLLCQTGAIAGNNLEADFARPPDNCKPWVFFFFENEFMDQPGITADLEALKSVGVGGLIVFAEYRPGMKAGPVKMFSREYDAGMQHLLKEAERLGLLVSLFNCPGSSTAGGPWNSVEQSMKQFVWSETPVTGGCIRTLNLKQPFTVGGFYRDIAVTAYPVSLGARLTVTPKISAPKADANPGEMMDGDLLTSSLFRGTSQKDKREIRLDYDGPVTVGRLAVHGNLFKYSNPLNYELEASEDGKIWKKIAAVSQQGNNTVTADFPAVTGKYFRLLVSTKTENFWIAELDLLPPGGRPRVYPQFNDWGTSTGRDKDSFEAFRPLLLSDDKPLDPSRAIDLTAQMKDDGTLTWKVPEGEWLVLREGYTTSGKKNHPAEGDGSGYEVDKFDPQLVRRHSEEGLRRMSGNSIGAPSLKMYHTDSWEAGGQSWSENLTAEFERRNGYSMRPFLPVLAGKQVKDADTTRRFLEDFRRTQQALVSESYYGVMQEVSRSKGLHYLAESAAASITIARPLDYLTYVDVPAGEAWSFGNFTSDGNIAGGLRDAVSASHMLGKPTTPVEVFTSNRGDWNMSPRYLKAFGDKILATGANQLVFHCYIHQPSTDIAPGWTMNHYGTTLNRHVTWWNQAQPWVQSISRSAVMLRQGRTVADFSRVIADDESIVNPDFADRQVFWDAPAGYANDWMAFGNLIDLFHVDQGEIVSSAGTARYRFIVLPERDRMTLEAVKKLHELVEAGGVILGPRPAARAGLRGGEAADKEFAQHVAALWGDKPVQDRTVGKGRVLTGMTADAALALLDVKPDLTWTTADATPVIRWHHRRDGSRDIYFVANGSSNALQAVFSFRAAGRTPQLWYPETGIIRSPAAFRFAEDRTEIPVELGPAESVFVVFEPNGKSYPKAASVSTSPLKEISGPWKVSFEGVEAPAPQVLEKLIPLNKHTDPSVRFFSGTIIYSATFEARIPNPASGIFLDLGEVREVAEVVLNGESLGVAWKPPFRFDVTGKLRAGKNEVVVRAVNTWANRLIGDAALPEAERHTWTSFTHYKKTDTLPDSGLIGPVTLMTTAAAPSEPLVQKQSALPVKAPTGITTNYYDDFSGAASASLIGQAPKVRSGAEVYLSNNPNLIKADGSLTGTGIGTACLPFKPGPGNVYELKIDMVLTPGAKTHWAAIAFASDLPASDKGLNLNQKGMFLLRDTGDGQLMLGGGTINGGATSLNITPNKTTAQLKIVLDTRLKLWAVDFQIDGVSCGNGTFSKSNPAIQYIGIGKYGNVTGSVDNFTLTTTGGD
jgi:hypothetical protein